MGLTLGGSAGEQSGANDWQRIDDQAVEVEVERAAEAQSIVDLVGHSKGHLGHLQFSIQLAEATGLRRQKQAVGVRGPVGAEASNGQQAPAERTAFVGVVVRPGHRRQHTHFAIGIGGVRRGAVKRGDAEVVFEEFGAQAHGRPLDGSQQRRIGVNCANRVAEGNAGAGAA